eukprot:15457564-Alexandrium_andersonii.AAC.1
MATAFRQNAATPVRGARGLTPSTLCQTQCRPLRIPFARALTHTHTHTPLCKPCTDASARKQSECGRSDGNWSARLCRWDKQAHGLDRSNDATGWAEEARRCPALKQRAPNVHQQMCDSAANGLQWRRAVASSLPPSSARGAAAPGTLKNKTSGVSQK